MKAVAARFPNVAMGIHTHNDSELAVANSLVAVEVGATMVQGVLNGYGERCGNANLCSIMPALILKMGKELTCAPNLKNLRSLSHLLDEMVDQRPPRNRPYVASVRAQGRHACGRREQGVAQP